MKNQNRAAAFILFPPLIRGDVKGYEVGSVAVLCLLVPQFWQQFYPYCSFVCALCKAPSFLENRVRFCQKQGTFWCS